MLLGPLIPELRDAWGVSRPELAMLFPAQFFASAVGSVLSSFRPKWSLVVGYSCMASGMVVVAWLPWPAPMAGFVVAGFGLGLVASATNLRVARAARPAGEEGGRRGANLSLLNMMWGLGAVSCPLLFAGVAGRIPAQWVLSAAAVVIAVPALLLMWLPAASRQSARVPIGEPDPPVRQPSAGWTALTLLPMAGLFFFYVGIEASVGGWLVAYAESVAPAGSGGLAKSVVPLLIGSGFWAALLLGRGLSPWVLRRVSEPRLYLAALSTSLAGALCLRFAASEIWVAAAAVVMGFGLAPVFPLTVSFLAGQTEAAGGRQAGWVFAFAGLGGAALPWLTGRLPAADASLAGGFIVPVVALVIMFGLFGLQRRIAR